MGEALITRRGGTVKRGSFVESGSSDMTNTITEPALIGAKNAIIFLSKSGTYHNVGSGVKDNAVATIIIENEQVVSTITITESGTTTSTAQNISFNAENGSITRTSGEMPWFVFNNLVPAYDYIILD